MLSTISKSIFRKCPAINQCRHFSVTPSSNIRGPRHITPNIASPFGNYLHEQEVQVDTRPEDTMETKGKNLP